MVKIQDSQHIARLAQQYPTTRYFRQLPPPVGSHIIIEFMRRGSSSRRRIPPGTTSTSFSPAWYRSTPSLLRGRKFPIATVGSDGTVGEVELCGQYVPFYAEVARKSECLVLSIADCRRYLSDDPVFLRFLLHILAEKLTFGSNIDYSVEDMNERVLFYLRSQPGRQIDHVEEATYGLRCSRSSLQRSLVQLCRGGEDRENRKGRLPPEINFSFPRPAASVMPATQPPFTSLLRSLLNFSCSHCILPEKRYNGSIESLHIHRIICGTDALCAGSPGVYGPGNPRDFITQSGGNLCGSQFL